MRQVNKQLSQTKASLMCYVNDHLSQTKSLPCVKGGGTACRDGGIVTIRLYQKLLFQLLPYSNPRADFLKSKHPPPATKIQTALWSSFLTKGRFCQNKCLSRTFLFRTFGSRGSKVTPLVHFLWFVSLLKNKEMNIQINIKSSLSVDEPQD